MNTLKMNLDLMVYILEIIYQKQLNYVINLDEYENAGKHWVSLFVKPKYTVYFDSFGIEHILKEINKSINTDIKSNNLEYKHTIQLCADIFV